MEYKVKYVPKIAGKPTAQFQEEEKKSVWGDSRTITFMMGQNPAETTKVTPEDAFPALGGGPVAK
jgi:hypothetical protein